MILNNYWNSIEALKKRPENINNIKIISFKKFSKLIENKDHDNLIKIINDLYNGDFYIIRSALKKKYINYLQESLHNYSLHNRSSFYKMKENCPNFWRSIDDNVSYKYAFKAVKEAFYFFRWNKEKYKLWKNFNKIWSYLKFLGGKDFKSFVSNTPKDLVVDRIQIVRYPEKTGYCELHSHPPNNQRLIISIYMSEIFKDYQSGGTYFIKSNKKLKVENKIKKGDVGIFYSTLKHGVDSVKLNKKQRKKIYSGRWWCGLYSPASDHKKKRLTSKPQRI